MTAAVHSLRRFALTVPDLAQAEHFYRCFGLDVAPLEGGGLSIRTIRDGARGREVARMHHGPRKRLHHLSFGAFAGDVERIASQAREAGATEVDARGERGLWFADPDGRIVHVTVDENRSPKARVSEPLIVHEGPNAAPSHDLEVRPRRLGHVLLLTPDVGRTAEFYGRALGLRVSDESAGLVAFLHHPHGSDHHVIAFVQSTAPAFHHASFEVPTIDAIGIGAGKMAGHGFKEGWGLGRHYAGSNFFHYVRDPWGSFAEYFCDMDYIPEGTPWEPRQVTPEYSLHTWGPDVPDYFLLNSEA